MRKTKDVTITRDNAPSEDGRDDGVVYRITEMSAFQADKWATRATLALIPRLAQAVSEETLEMIRANPGMLTLERIGLLLGGIAFPEVESLMDELIMDCVQILPAAAAGHRPLPRAIGLGGSEDVKEVATLHYLRSEVMALHANFTMAAGILSLITAASRMSPYESTSTSDDGSEPSSPPERPRSTNSRRSTA